MHKISKSKKPITYPLSYGQTRLWSLASLHPEQGIYNMIIDMLLTGNFNVIAFRNAFSQLLERHELLRVKYSFEDGVGFSQSVMPMSDFSDSMILTEMDCTKWASFEIAKFVSDQNKIPFHLDDVLFKNFIIKLANNSYRWLFVIQHSIFDGYSQVIFLRELGQLYKAKLENSPVTLSRIPWSYFDYLNWQYKQSFEFETKIALWKDYLNEAEPTQLVADFVRPETNSHISARIPVSISITPKELKEKFPTISSYVLFLTIFQWLLNYYTGKLDLCFGTVSSSRKQPAIKEHLKDTIGFFVNTLAMRFALNPQDSFEQALNHTQEIVEAYIYENSDLPFERVAETLQSSTSLFNILFVWQDSAYQQLQLSQIEVTPQEIRDSSAVFDLVLELRPCEQGFVGFFEYDTAIFSENLIARLAQHFTKLSSTLVVNPTVTLQKLNLISEDDLASWKILNNNYQIDTDTLRAQGSIPAIIDTYPHIGQSAVLYVCESANIRVNITYSALKQRSTRLGSFLNKKFQADELKNLEYVGFCIEHSPAGIVAMLGIMKSGKAFVPLDASPDNDARRVAIIKQTKLKVIVVTEHTKKLFSNDFMLIEINAVGSLVITEQAKKNLDESAIPNIANISLSDPAYVEFTSGTTGEPKGVVISHIGLINWFNVLAKKYAITSKDKVFLSSPFTFDASIWMAFCLAIPHGAQLVINPAHERLNSSAVASLFTQEQITIATFTPSMLQEYKPSTMPALRLIFLIGEEIPKNLIKKWKDYNPNLIIINGYGPTEVTAGSNLAKIDDNILQRKQSGRLPIGYPIDNMFINIFDAQGKLVPVGVPGEMYIGGVGLGKYLNPKQTAERFIKTKLPSSAEEQIMYKTGDQGRLIKEGEQYYLEFLGRIEQSAEYKINGVRIDLREITGIFSQYPNIQQVVPCIFGERQKTVVIFIKLTEQNNVDKEKEELILLNYLKSRIPPIPLRLHIVDKLPYKPNSGKLDVGQLEKMDTTELEKPQRIEDNPNPELVSLWRRILDLRPTAVITSTTSFYQLGGNSLSLVRMLHSVESLYQIPNNTLLFKTRNIGHTITIAGIEELIDQVLSYKIKPNF